MKITVEHEPTGTTMLSLGERFLPIGTTLKAGARSAFGRNPDESSTSFLRFVGENRQELSPPCVQNRLGHSRRALLGHFLRGQILDGDQPVLRNNSVR